MFKDEYTESRSDKWRIRLRKLALKLTNGEEVAERLIKDIDSNVSFWKAVKENPVRRSVQVSSQGVVAGNIVGRQYDVKRPVDQPQTV